MDRRLASGAERVVGCAITIAVCPGLRSVTPVHADLRKDCLHMTRDESPSAERAVRRLRGPSHTDAKSKIQDKDHRYRSNPGERRSLGGLCDYDRSVDETQERVTEPCRFS